MPSSVPKALLKPGLVNVKFSAGLGMESKALHCRDIAGQTWHLSPTIPGPMGQGLQMTEATLKIALFPLTRPYQKQKGQLTWSVFFFFLKEG